MQNLLLPIDLRISDRNDCPCHQMFYYVTDQSVLYNIRYALIFDSLRPENEDDSIQAVGNSKSEWISFSRAKKIANNYTLLICLGESQELITLQDESTGDEISNTNSLFEGCSVIMIKKEYAKIRIGMQNRKISDDIIMEDEEHKKESTDITDISSDKDSLMRKKRGTEIDIEEEMIYVNNDKLLSETSSDSEEIENESKVSNKSTKN